MKYYFKFNVKYVMNITDIDDKIILRGRQAYLLAQFKQNRLSESLNDNQTRLTALETYIKKYLPEATITKSADLVLSGHHETLLAAPAQTDSEAKSKMYIRTAVQAAKAIKAMDSKVDVSDIESDSLDDVLMSHLDKMHGSSVNEHTVWTRLTKHYEERFTEDMRALNCLDPDEVTRVTEYGPQIVDFVERIEKNRFAYSVGGDVYFDVAAFEAANNKYARLEPWNRNDTKLQAEGEGALTEGKTGKRSTADFALWKSSKPGEPSWPSPWGDGRPGWHIECSAMAFDKLGSQIDIHSGGIDLAFPHHDNELAQSEAYWANECHGHQHQWINYFLHMGHLSIAGAKMSKSLKNFTTIRNALARGDYTSRSMRIVFLLGVWKDGIEITEGLTKEASAWEDKLNNFFLKAKEIEPENAHHNGIVDEQPLMDVLAKAKEDTFESLCDSFHTSSVMAIISNLLTAYNAAPKSQTPPFVTLAIAQWVTSIVNIFGLNGTAGPDDQATGWSGIDVPEGAKPVLQNLSEKRDFLRLKAKEGISAQDLDPVPYPRQSTSEEIGFREVLETFNKDLVGLQSSENLTKDVRQLCDDLRDIHLFDRGVYLEDREDQPALIRPVTKELRAARQEKEERARQKQKAKEAREKEAASRADKGRLSPKDMFQTEEFSAWDVEGLPTHEKNGEELTKSKRKKLQKDWERQKKLHEAWKKTSAA
ncbi:cysteinyl-tRNA synthetase [Lecanora helva]